ncbi:MAG: DUF4258 domain-containing protein [Acidobacteria bacterium]|nr:DUF4258 domain-containing protein [Acidobacteriota bacterium]
MSVHAKDEVLFEVETPLGFCVRVTWSRWEFISTVKHPAMSGKELSVKAALETPDQIRQSRSDSKVFLFYKAAQSRWWVCAVAKKREGSGFLITAYPTDAIKEGVRVWPK